MKLLHIALLGAAFALTGCAATGPSFADAEKAAVKLSPDQGRVYFYRNDNFVGGGVRPEIKLDGAVVGQSTPGGYFVVDSKPGSHEASTSTEVASRLTFVLDKGETKYVRTDVNMGLLVGHVVPSLIGEEQAKKELVSLKNTSAGAK
ncbi:MAG: DUF2846 domain-containing protein [Massilia sp.]